MNSLAWLAQHRIEAVFHREYDWVLAFDGDVLLVVACLWRLVGSSRVLLTSEDDGQQFGLPATIDAATELKRHISGATIEAVAVQENTLDVELRFNTGHILQVIPDSSGYEAWIAYDGVRQFVAVGGGNLAILGDAASK